MINLHLFLYRSTFNKPDFNKKNTIPIDKLTVINVECDKNKCKCGNTAAKKCRYNYKLINYYKDFEHAI